MGMKRCLQTFGLAIVVTGYGAAAVAEEINVKLGVLADMSGIFSDIGGAGAANATRMAAEDFMKRPGSENFKVEVVAADAQNKPDVSNAIARQWLNADGVHALVDMPTSAISLSLAPLAKEANKVALLTASGTSDLTGAACSPNSVHWTYDTWALAHGTADALTREGEKSWFFITVDFALGHSLQRDATAVIEANGGEVRGAVRHPTDTKDFSSYLLQAQATQAQVIALANAGGDTIGAIKQASEFGIVQAGQKLAGMLLFISDIHSLGLETAQGLLLTTAFYWDLNDETRAFSERYAERNDGKMPTMNQAGAYSATLAYLEAVKQVGSPEDGAAVVTAMRERGQFDDPLFGQTWLREDGRVVHDMHLVEVKSPEQSKKPWDYYTVRSTIPAERAFRPIEEGGCPLVQ